MYKMYANNIFLTIKFFCNEFISFICVVGDKIALHLYILSTYYICKNKYDLLTLILKNIFLKIGHIVVDLAFKVN